MLHHYEFKSSMARSSPPEINYEPEYCPQAVIDWYVCSASKDQRHNTDLSLKAKKHLVALGWEFWYFDKKTRWELRYKSPTNGKSYNSLRTACKACINDGGCDPQNVPSSHQPMVEPPSTAPISSSPPQESHHIPAKQPISHQTMAELDPPSTTAISSSAQEAHPTLKKPRTCKKPRGKQRRSKKRKGESLDEEWTLPQAVLDASSSSSSSGGSKSGKVLRSRNSVRHVDEAQSSDSSCRNPRTVLSWLIDNKVVLPEARVHCRGGNNEVKRGRLLRSGVACDCCGLVFTLTRFEAHAGCTKHRPAASIFLEDGRSLMDCQREAFSSQENNMHNYVVGDSLQDQNDSICSFCLEGGDLLLCDRCPSSFHKSCLGLEEVPDGDWFCPLCCCKICNRPRCREDCADHVDNSITACDQCERKYHIGCLRSRGFTKLKNHPDEVWFCNGVCENIFFSLQMMIGKPVPVGHDNLTWTLLKTMKSNNCGYHDLGNLSRVESKLSVALGVMHECFKPIIDAISGRDIVADVIFSKGSRLNRLNFRGFYTVILERNDEVISVANIRIYGHKIAEVPLVATTMQFRRLGMCRILMDELEKQLNHLGVERMLLPASNYLVDTWINSFGFARMTDSDKSQQLDYTFLHFQDTILCHKSLKEPSMLYMA